jgi:hypothetical protein
MAKKAKETMSLSDFARKHGVDRKTATRWRQAGHIVPATGPVDVAASERRLAERPAQNRGGFAKGPHADEAASSSGTALAEAKRVRMTFEALLAEARAEKLADSIVATGPAIDAVAADMAAIKARFREVPASVAPRLVDVDTAPLAAAIVMKAICAALGDISGQPVHDATSKYLTPGKEKGIPADELTLYKVDCDGVAHYIRKSRDDIEQPVVEEPKKPKRRRRSIPEIEAVIAETGAEAEVDNELVYAVERAIPTMSLTGAKTRREVAEGTLRRGQFDLLKKRVVRVDKVIAALTQNSNSIRTNALAIAAKTAPRVALLTDAKEIERVISKELESVLADLAEPRKLIEGALNK